MSPVIYFDNAATTPLDNEILDVMLPFMKESFGNPSSTYSVGRTARLGLESARKKVARLLGVNNNTIFFTSGGTESNNTAINAAVRDLHCTHIITSPIEHHAVLNTVKHYSREHRIDYSLVTVNEYGEVMVDNLEKLLKEQTAAGHKVLVSLMHANNETGSLLDLERVGNLCRTYNAIFHSDCVQTVGHYHLDLKKAGVHFISGSGHKFHGPKGTGLLYISDEVQIQPLIHGGKQESNMRAGTENTYGIVGFARALELAMENLEAESKYIGALKDYMKQALTNAIKGIEFNSPDNSLYTVLSIGLPKSDKTESLLLELDMAGVCVSAGSACSSNSNGHASHVMRALDKGTHLIIIRFSFSKYNTQKEVDATVEILKKIID